MSDKNPREFGTLRSFFWPIYSDEYGKLLPMLSLFFLISFVYNMTRTMKISLMVTAAGSGAIAIPFLKVGAVLPGALLFTYIFTKLIARFNRERVFYIMVGFFLSFFIFFLFVLLPNRHVFELSALTDYLEHLPFWPSGFNGLLAVIRHWSLSIFYVLCEMWSNIVLSMLFWGFANEVTKVDEAKRFYAIFALSANISGIFSGQFASQLRITSPLSFLPYETAFEQTVFIQLVAVIFLILVIIAIFYTINRTVYVSEQDTPALKENELTGEMEPKQNLTLTQCFAYLAKSPYLRKIVFIVVAYNIVYNLADVVWTNRVTVAFAGDQGALHRYINQVTSITGIAAVFSALIISGNVIRRFGWTVAALVTPIVWLLTSVGFYTVFLASETTSAGLLPFLGDMLSTFAGNPANAALFFCSAQICLGRACKYTVFDETKEIAFIPLSREEQRKAKAVVDGIATRFGKSGGSVIILIIFAFCGDLVASLPYITAIIFAAMIIWIFAVVSLGKTLKKSVDHVDHQESTAQNGVKERVNS